MVQCQRNDGSAMYNGTRLEGSPGTGHWQSMKVTGNKGLRLWQGLAEPTPLQPTETCGRFLRTNKSMIGGYTAVRNNNNGNQNLSHRSEHRPKSQDTVLWTNDKWE